MNPTHSRATLRAYLCELAAYEADPFIYRFLRAAIRMVDERDGVKEMVH